MRAPISKKALDMLNDPKKAVELIEAIRRARAAQGDAQNVQIGGEEYSVAEIASRESDD
jgi:hypothetical protein